MAAKKFIYAVIENNPISLTGISGIADAPLETVCCKDLAAIISAVDEDRFDCDLSANAASERLQSDLQQYQRVNSIIRSKSCVGGMLPLKFGFTAGGSTEVKTVLERAYLQLRSHLDRLKGTAELVVQVSWDLSRIIHQIARDHPELVGVDAVKTGKQLFEATEVKRLGYIEEVHELLLPLSREFSDGPLKSESMILNRSYLLDGTMQAQFDDAMSELGERHDASLSFRYIGPLPVYSFINIELNQGNFALLDGARKTLKLPESASWGQIKTAYRQQLLVHHPDSNPDDPDATSRCREIVTAFELLNAYCQSRRNLTAMGAEAEYIFSRDEVEKIFITDDKCALLARTNLSEHGRQRSESGVSL